MRIVNPTTAITVINQFASGTVYKGLAITTTNIYATDFHNNKIDTYGPTFLGPLSGFPFVDPTIPVGFAPFNIVLLNGQLYVTYAKQDSVAHDDVAGPGNGFISIFDLNGVFIRRLVSQEYLNSPWAIISASPSFELPLGSIVVGNFGDGTISTYSADGKFLGKLRDKHCVDIILAGLWGLTQSDPTSFKHIKIFFSSGPNAEANGLIGYLTSIF